MKTFFMRLIEFFYVKDKTKIKIKELGKDLERIKKEMNLMTDELKRL